MSINGPVDMIDASQYPVIFPLTTLIDTSFDRKSFSRQFDENQSKIVLLQPIYKRQAKKHKYLTF
jgi:hypothetical protein